MTPSSTPHDDAAKTAREAGVGIDLWHTSFRGWDGDGGRRPGRW
jgi:hypothetical protein